MKNDVMPSIVQMDTEDLRKLTAEVKETIATGIQMPGPKQKRFSTADNWLILRNSRSASDRMRK